MVVLSPYSWSGLLTDIERIVWRRGTLLGCTCDGWLVIGYAFHKKRRRSE